MSFTALILRSLRHYWRTHLGVLLGVAVATAVLVGAMVVGDSVRLSLRAMALARLGETHLAMVPQERFFSSQLSARLGGQLDAPAAAVMLLPGVATHQAKKMTVVNVQVLGVDASFSSLFPAAGSPSTSLKEDEVHLNEKLAAELGAAVGDDLLLLVARPSLLPRDAPLTRTDKADITLSLPVKVTAIVPDAAGGRFSLQASQAVPRNAFLNLAWLQKQLNLTDRANLLLVGAARQGNLSADAANAAVQQSWRLDDVGVRLAAVGAAGRARLLPSREPSRGAGTQQPQQADATDSPRPGRSLALPSGDADPAQLELRSTRIFLDPPLEQAAVAAAKELNIAAVGVLTYLVNELDAGRRKTPYSMASALGVLTEPAGGWPTLNGQGVGLADLMIGATPASGEVKSGIVINEWLANDLRVNVGDMVTLKYFVVGDSRQLVEKASEPMRVVKIVPLAGAAADQTFLPDYPNIPQEGENFGSWKAGFEFTRQIRDADEQYWDDHRGTPKAFIPLKLGEAMWANRFGNLTSIRFVGDVDPVKLEAAIRAKLDPAAIGLSFVPVREQALKASGEGFDFAQLFLGFSFFLIVAALLLTGLLFVFAIEQRSAEVGTLLAVGFKPRQVRRLLMGEGLALALIGAAIGTCVGLLYTQAILRGLSTVWRGAVGTSSLHFHVTPVTLVIGFGSSVLVAMGTIGLVLRKQGRQPAIALLRGAAGGDGSPSGGRGRVSLALGAVMMVGAIALLLTTGVGREAKNAGAFFGAGSLLLAGGLSLCFGMLTRLARPPLPLGEGGGEGRPSLASSLGIVSSQANPSEVSDPLLSSALTPALSQGERGPEKAIRLTLTSLGLRGSARRRGRSLATVGLLACGTFLVVAIGAFWLDSSVDANDRKAGTGGFELYGESTLPVIVDLNTTAGLDKFALEKEDLPGVSFVPMRMRDGDDASCLNLNRAQNPRLCGVDMQRLAQLSPFTFASSLTTTTASPWASAVATSEPDVIPAIGDQNTIVYGLGKGLGDTLEYADEFGSPVKVKIVALLSNSILQGSLFIDESHFKKLYPSVSGYRVFLIDAPPEKAADMKTLLTKQMDYVGLDLTPTVERLAMFNAVQNTYLGIFQALGGLGLLLGSVGLGIVVLRNVLERRGELAVLAAVGFTRRKLRWLVVSEHWLLLAVGLLVGLIAAIVAVLPAVLSPGAKVPYALLCAIIAGVVVSGVVWTLMATRWALRGALLAALREE